MNHQLNDKKDNRINMSINCKPFLICAFFLSEQDVGWIETDLSVCFLPNGDRFLRGGPRAKADLIQNEEFSCGALDVVFFYRD